MVCAAVSRTAPLAVSERVRLPQVLFVPATQIPHQMPRHQMIRHVPCSALSPSQDLAADPAVAPYICGAVAADGPVAPGGTWRGTLMVDDAVCPDPVYSVVTMLGEWFFVWRYLVPTAVKPMNRPPGHRRHVRQVQGLTWIRGPRTVAWHIAEA